MIYCRVSTDEQAERGTSLGDQASRCETYCAEHSWRVVDRFVDDGYSGGTIDRPALRLLSAGAAQRLFDVVVVTDPDRLSRDLVDGLTLERDLAASGIEVIYLIQPTMGTLERQLRGVIAEEERRKIRDRTMRGRRAITAAGFWPGGPPPFGYRIRSLDNGRSVLALDDKEANVLKAMVDCLVDERLTTWEIAAALNAREVPTPSAGGRRGSSTSKRWTHRRVRETLAAATCIAGTWTYNSAAGQITLEVPAIINEARLEQLKIRLAETTTGPGATKHKHFFLLARRITSECGNPMHGYARPDGTGRAYRCSTSTADVGPDRCDCVRANADVIDAAAWNSIVAELTDANRLARLAGLAIGGTTKSSVEDVSAVDRRVKRIEKALGSQVAQLLAAGHDATVIGHATAQLETELHTLRQQRAQLVRWAAQRSEQSQHLDRVQRLAAAAQRTLKNPTDDIRRNVVELLDLRVRIVNMTSCPTCAGRGLLSRGQQPDAAARHHTGDICPTCVRSKRIPNIEISGLLPFIDDLVVATPTNEPPIPFRLKGVG